MRTKHSLLLAACASALAAVLAVAAAQVAVDYDHRADFSRYRTYSWLGVNTASSLWKDRVMTATDSQLAAKGLTKVPSGGDMAVAANGHVSEHDTLQTFYDGFPGWGWRGWGGNPIATTEVIPERVGNLTIDLFDGAGKQLIWRGVASETLSSKPEKNERKLDEALQKMFKHYPPQAKS